MKLLNRLFGKNRKTANTSERQNNEESEKSQMYVAGAENRENSGELITVERVEGTPFSIIIVQEWRGEDNAFIALGHNRLSERMTVKEAREKIEKHDWKLITQVVAFIADKMKAERDMPTMKVD